MRDGGRVGIAWALSALCHAALLLLAVSGGPAAGGEGMRLMELGLVEMPGVEKAPSAPPSEPATANEPSAPRHGDSGTPTRSGRKTALPAADKDGAAAPPSAAAPSGGTAPAVEDPGWGSGEGFILSRPVSFPKNAQNEGVEGIVRLAIYLAAGGNPSATVLEGSGDPRLDQYSLRVVTEAWRYATPPSGVRLLVRLVFRDDQVEVIFDRATPWNGEDP